MIRTIKWLRDEARRLREVITQRSDPGRLDRRWSADFLSLQEDMVDSGLVGAASGWHFLSGDAQIALPRNEPVRLVLGSVKTENRSQLPLRFADTGLWSGDRALAEEGDSLTVSVTCQIARAKRQGGQWKPFRNQGRTSTQAWLEIGSPGLRIRTKWVTTEGTPVEESTWHDVNLNFHAFVGPDFLSQGGASIWLRSTQNAILRHPTVTVFLQHVGQPGE